MELAESLVLRCYHLPVYDWTPLSQDPCWTCSVTWLPNVQHKSNLLLHMSTHPAWLTSLLGSSYLEYEVWNPGNTIQMAPGAVSMRVTLCYDLLRHSPWLTICPQHFSYTFFGKHFLGQTFFHTFFGPDIFPSTFFGKGKEIYMKIYLFALPRRSPMPECPMHTDLPPMMSLLIGLPSSTIIP